MLDIFYNGCVYTIDNSVRLSRVQAPLRGAFLRIIGRPPSPTPPLQTIVQRQHDYAGQVVALQRHHLI